MSSGIALVIGLLAAFTLAAFATAFAYAGRSGRALVWAVAGLVVLFNVILRVESWVFAGIIVLMFVTGWSVLVIWCAWGSYVVRTSELCKPTARQGLDL